MNQDQASDFLVFVSKYFKGHKKKEKKKKTAGFFSFLFNVFLISAKSKIDPDR